MQLIQDDQLEMAMWTLSSQVSALVSCNPSYLCFKKMGAISEDEKRRRQEEECRNLLLEILDNHLQEEYSSMLAMFF